ncbi:hypothetical protein [Parvibaculum sp.]|jgi:hypothetical protein|uniref:hypothetical protein n=2 Tax=Parvibaculum sp. TaxID=2024848 RepID=UPI001B201D6A|nr:hypothetical protein [Parvibaculum sp.]MBO6678814.1 hypothetical protein [Parvibaculum sp.]
MTVPLTVAIIVTPIAVVPVLAFTSAAIATITLPSERRLLNRALPGNLLLLHVLLLPLAIKLSLLLLLLLLAMQPLLGLLLLSLALLHVLLLALTFVKRLLPTL